MSEYKSPLNGYSMQDALEKVKETEKKKLDTFEEKLNKITNKDKKQP